MLGWDTPGVATLTICVDDIICVLDVDTGFNVEKFKGFAVKDVLVTSIFPDNSPGQTKNEL